LHAKSSLKLQCALYAHSRVLAWFFIDDDDVESVNDRFRKRSIKLGLEPSAVKPSNMPNSIEPHGTPEIVKDIAGNIGNEIWSFEAGV
jgi:hypothetical protein